MSAAIVTATLNPCVDKTFSVEQIVPDRKLSATNVHRYAGGGGINVARAARRLGGEAAALWSCGGPVGVVLAGLLADENVRHEPIAIAGETRENVIAFDDSSSQQYRFGLPGPTLTDLEQSRWRDRLSNLSPAPEYLVLSGSTPPGVGPHAYADLIRAMPSETRIVVDTKGPALRRAIEVGVYLVKPNVRELAEVVGHPLFGDRDVEAAARELFRHGSTVAALVSLGRGGALLVTRETAEHIAAPTVPAKSKVGAGDSTVAGMVVALVRGHSLVESARFGVAAGAAAVMTEGTELCRREDAERLYAQMAQTWRA